MRAENTFSVDFVPRLGKKNKEEATLYARITVNGTPKEVSLKCKVKASDWNHDKEQVKGTGFEAKHINDYIEKVRYRIRDKYRMLEEKNLPITAETVKNAYLANHNPNRNSKTFSELYEYHMKINEKVLKPGTTKNYGATKKYVMRFLKSKLKREDIYLTELDYQFITELKHFIRTNPIKKHDPCEGNGVYKHLERLKKMVAWAKKLKWISIDPFEDYSLGFKKAKRKKLQLDEVIHLSSQKFNDELLRYVRDLFIFACYTGLAYADTISLTDADFMTTNDGALWCTKYRQKTDELSPIPIFENARLILEKYKKLPTYIQTGKIFPAITNQEVNRSLKIIREICGINKELSFHVARHTFATTMTLKNGVPLETVSKMLGHKKLSTTQIYAEVDEEKIQEDMINAEERILLKIAARKKELSRTGMKTLKQSHANCNLPS